MKARREAAIAPSAAVGQIAAEAAGAPQRPASATGPVGSWARLASSCFSLLTKIVGGFLIGLITLYRGLSAVTPASCRYDPSCSAYGIEAIRLHGPAKGGWLALRRMLRCHPWGGFGYDPVPPRENAAAGGDHERRCPQGRCRHSEQS